jgi:hypothetical protein
MKKMLMALTLAGMLASSTCCTWEYPDLSSSYKHNTLIRGGYKETQISTDVYQITFEGNWFTTKKKAIRYALIRAAEVAQMNQNEYFIVLDKIDESSTTNRIEFQKYFTYDIFSGFFSSISTDSSFSSNPSYTIMIKTLKNRPSCDNYFVVNDILQTNTLVLQERGK